MVIDSFYCKRICGDPNFSIDEWNKRFELGIKMGLSNIEMDKLLNETGRCKEQCIDCTCIVEEQRMKTERLILNTE